jgi:hypothetical protein
MPGGRLLYCHNRAACPWTFDIWLAVDVEGGGAAGPSPEDNIFPPCFLNLIHHVIAFY